MKKIQNLAPGQGDREATSVYHGGDLSAARRLFPDAPRPFIDLSTGINPEPYPIPLLPPEVFARLPDREGLRELEAAAAQRYGASPDAQVVAAPGTQALIQLLPQLQRAKTVGILGFTYGEYQRIWRAAGIVPRVIESLDGLAKCDLAVIVNPNNPDGRLVPAGDLSALADHLASKGGLLVIDEAFVDLLPPEASLVPLLREGALVLRSFGKTYGLPGLRLGFAIAHAPLATRMRTLLGPWAVSGPAIAIGGVALTDPLWLKTSLQHLAHQAAIVEAALRECGAERIGGTPLFQLFAHPQAEKLADIFGQRGVLLRRFAERPNWLRVGHVAHASEARFNSVAREISRTLERPLHGAQRVVTAP